ncbi:MAG: ArsA-related P-loop ATPase [Myxococcota bacterium]|nr:ArsA-related P-loop ATPase [Myxococcota bacterium]
MQSNVQMKELIQNQKLLICVGAGGVGKTSLSATIGLQAALMGRKVLVLTIDPAKRLANSLGLKQFGNTETQIDLSQIGDVKGELWAMMLDGKKTFNDLIDKLSKDEQTKRSILNNNIYQSITETIVGNQEYMATEKLYDVVSSGRYDLIVLDTPPVKNALDFLDSPGRMARFVDKRVMKWFLTSKKGEKRIIRRLLAGSSAVLFKLLGYVFGQDFLEDIAIFFSNFRDLYEGFQERHSAVEALFRDKKTCFMIVCAPHKPALEVAEFFLKELKKRKMRNPGVIVNQRHFAHFKNLNAKAFLQERCDELSQDLSAHTASMLLARLGVSHKRLHRLALEEDALVLELSKYLDKQQRLWSIQRMHGEVHDLHGLVQVGNQLFVNQE